MAKKLTPSQKLSRLKKELSIVNKKNKLLEVKRKKAEKIEIETRKVKAELKKMNKSAFAKKFSKFNKERLTKAEAIKFGKKSKIAAVKSYKTGKKIWNGLGVIVEHLDKMNDPIKLPSKKVKKRRK